MIVGGWIFWGPEIGKLICQLVGFVDQCWQALRANIKLLTLEFNSEERSLLFGGIAVQASGRWHGFSLNKCDATFMSLVIGDMNAALQIRARRAEDSSPHSDALHSG